MADPRYITADEVAENYEPIVGGGGSPGGSDTQIQFNDSNSFGGNSALTFDKTGGSGASLLINPDEQPVVFGDLSWGPVASALVNYLVTQWRQAVEIEMIDNRPPGSLDIVALGIQVATLASDATSHNLFGVYIKSPFSGGSAPASIDGIFIIDLHGVGTVSNALHIANQGSSDFAIKVEGGKNDLGPDPTIAVFPTSDPHVAGAGYWAGSTFTKSAG